MHSFDYWYSYKIYLFIQKTCDLISAKRKILFLSWKKIRDFFFPILDMEIIVLNNMFT